MADARFEDGDEGPLRLIAQSADDLSVLSALVQDAVFPATEMRLDRKARRFAILLNRFRWEDEAASKAAGRPYERVRSLLVIDDVLKVRTQGVDPRDKDLVLSLLSISFTETTEGAGTVMLVLAGDGAVAVDVEVLDLRLDDVTKPYIAPSRQMPQHKD